MPAPITPNLPTAREQLQRKYRQLGATVGQFDPHVANSLATIDAARVAKGQSPLTNPQTFIALRAGQTGQSHIPAPERSSSLTAIPGNFARDIAVFGQSIPQLPGAIIQEFKDLGQFDAIAEEKGIREAPFVRMAVGEQSTLGSIMDGRGLQQAAQHPFFTALDVLPVAKGIGKIPTSTGTVASTIADSAAMAPVRAAGRGVADSFNATRPGVKLQEAFGANARNVSRESAQADRLLQEAASGTSDLTPTIYGDALNQQIADLTRATTTMRETYAYLPPERQAALVNLAESGQWADELPNLPADEQAYLSQYRQITDDLTAIEAANGTIYDFKGEWYDQATGTKLFKGEREVEYATSMSQIRGAIDDPTSILPADLANVVGRITTSDALSNAKKYQALTGASHALDNMGYDGAAIRAQIKSAKDTSSPLTIDDAAVALLDALESPPAYATFSPDEIVSSLRPYARTNPSVRGAIEAINAGGYTRAKTILNGLAKGKTTDPNFAADITSLTQSLTDLAAQKKWVERTSNFSPKKVAKATKKQEARVARTVPARFIPSVQKKVQEGLLAKYATDPNFDQIAQRIEQGQYSAYPGLADEAKLLTREMAQSWQEMKAAGLDPIYVHHVSPAAAAASATPRLPLASKDPNWAKRRTMDMTPYARNMSVALNDQAIQLLARRGSEAFIDSMVQQYGRTRYMDNGPALGGLDDLYRTKAEAAASVNPSVDVQGRIDEMMSREWTVFDPQSVTPWRKGRGTAYTSAEQIYLPKPVAKVIEAIHTPKTYAITGVTDPVMKLFRTSVLALSPRWHFNNIIGGGALVAFEDATIFKQLANAKRLMKGQDVEVGGQRITRDQLSRESVIGTGFGGIPREVLEWDKAGKLPSSSYIATAAHNYLAGKTMRRLIDQGGKVIEKSYTFNGYVDDLYRSAAYLRAFEKSMKSGSKMAKVDGLGATSASIPREAAEQAGLNIARKVFQNWDAMTPIERSVMRHVFPFYGWVSHIMKYTLRYPIDHPIRAAVIGSFARAELEDLQDRGLPESFLNMMFLGNVDENGNQKAISTSAINPFANVGDSFTLAGLIGQLNPILGSFLTAAGIDSITGQAELYPDLTYDPRTGRFAANTPGFTGTLMSSVLPQGQAFLSMIGQNEKFKELQRTNPDAAVNMLRSQLGFPVVFRNVPVTQTQMKSELNRDEARTEAFKAALKSGDYSGFLSRYPDSSLAIDRIRELDEQGMLDPFRNMTEEGDIAQPQSQSTMFYDALVRRNLPFSNVLPVAGQYELQGGLLQRDPYPGN